MLLAGARPAGDAVKQKTIQRDELARLAFRNSRRLPQAIDEDGVRYEWVGIGWIDCGKARGDEVKVVG